MKPKEFNYCLQRISTDEKAFTKFYKFYYPKVFIHIYVKYRNKVMSEDVAHEFFLKLLTMDVSKIEYIEHPNSWVYTVVENIAKNILIKNKRISDEPIEDLHLPINDKYAYELYGDLWDKLNTLDEITRKIIIKKYIEGYHYKEIAEELGMTNEAVRQKCSRGMRKLKNCH